MKPSTMHYGNEEARISAEMLDGEEFHANSYEALVGLMRETAWGGHDSDGVKGYMKQVAKRIWDWSNREINCEDPAQFVRDLEQAGLVRITERQ